MPTIRSNLGLYLALGIPLTLLFVAVYGGINWFNAGRGHYFDLYFSWETGIPFVPAMILVYLSLQLLFLLPLVHCDATGLPVLAKRMALAILLAGVVFLLLPTRPGFALQPAASPFDPFYDLLYTLDRPHNLFPSLHVTLSTLVVASLLRRVRGIVAWLYAAWLALLYLSVLLVHQHHVADILGGILLAFLTIRLVAHPGPPQAAQGCA